LYIKKHSGVRRSPARVPRLPSPSLDCDRGLNVERTLQIWAIHGHS